MIALAPVRALTLDAPVALGRPAYLSAASGLALIADRLYVVADDELHLGVFEPFCDTPGGLIRLFEGELPLATESRKKQKPDLEALVRLPAFGAHHGALLALGSGSKPNRQGGAVLSLDCDWQLVGPPQSIDLHFLFHPLRTAFLDLNIEGAAVCGDTFVLLQRGNSGGSINARISYALPALCAAMLSGNGDGTLEPVDIQYYDLGEISGVPLCFTDASGLSDGQMIFTAVAEDTDDSYADGACFGSAIGIIDRNGRMTRLEQLAGLYKLEGIHAWPERDAIRFLVVTDADDVAIPAMVLSGALPG
ncbi:MAG: DUF6929 family protein [Gammaproteobacteria bacterium]